MGFPQLGMEPWPAAGKEQSAKHWTTREVPIFLNQIYLFFTTLGLCYCALAFSSINARASHCGGFSCCGTPALEYLDFSSYGSGA